MHNIKITFCGHGSVHDNSLQNKIFAVLKDLAQSHSDTRFTFFCGGYGTFDGIAAICANKLKTECLCSAEIILVSPYINITNSLKSVYSTFFYDTIISPIDNIPPKFAILQRNKWMVDNADIVICYIKHNYGGAYKTMQYAQSKNKTIISIK